MLIVTDFGGIIATSSPDSGSQAPAWEPAGPAAGGQLAVSRGSQAGAWEPGQNQASPKSVTARKNVLPAVARFARHRGSAFYITMWTFEIHGHAAWMIERTSPPPTAGRTTRAMIGGKIVAGVSQESPEASTPRWLRGVGDWDISVSSFRLGRPGKLENPERHRSALAKPCHQLLIRTSFSSRSGDPLPGNLRNVGNRPRSNVGKTHQ